MMRQVVENRLGVAGSLEPVGARRGTAQIVQTRGRRKVSAVYTRALLLLCVAGLCIGAGACVGTGNVCLNYDDGQCEWLARTRIDGARFDFNPPLAASQDFWLRVGDQLKVSWAQYALLNTHRGATCNFEGVTDNNTLNHDNCSLCTYCPWNYCGMLPVFTENAVPTLLPHDAMMAQSTLTPMRIDPVRDTGCASNGGFIFSPPSNATYELKATNIADEPTIMETHVFVLQSGAGQVVQYLIQPLAQAGVTDATFYSGTVPSAPILSDNFNTTVHISKARILKGQSDTDPLTGKLRLKDASPVHPSRLVFIPTYQGDAVYSHDATRCYANTNTDGDLDLTRCRSSYNNAGSNSLPATPTYLATDPAQLLTWVVEFKSSEGGVTPTLAAGEVLAIEFTIEAN